MIGIAQVLKESSAGFNIPQYARSPEQELIVKTYDWTVFFQFLNFKHIPNILQNYDFRFDSSHPSIVFFWLKTTLLVLKLL